MVGDLDQRPELRRPSTDLCVPQLSAHKHHCLRRFRRPPAYRRPVPTVSRYFGLSGPLEFLDVDVATDNRLFIDPHAVRIERGPSPFARRARGCITTFFDEVLACVLGERTEHGLYLLQHFNEPKETRLGMSKEGINGHGGASEIGSRVWHSLSTDLEALIRVGALKWVEDIPVFVEGVDKDITSDLTTRIIFEPLAQFTQAMTRKYPQFTSGGREARVFHRQVWSPRRARWVQKPLELPVASDKPLLLVPKYWARPRLLMSAGRYYGTSLLSYVQDDRAVVDPETGKVIKEPKRALRRRREFERGLETILRVTQHATERNEDLLSRFRAFVDGRYVRLDDDEIVARLG